MIQTTSRKAYEEIRPELGRRQWEVLMVLTTPGHRVMGFTNSEIALNLHLPISSITPRVNELRKKGLVQELRKRTCGVTGFTAIAWTIVEETEEQGSLF